MPQAPQLYEVEITEAAVGHTRLQGRVAEVIRGTLRPEYFDALFIPAYQRLAMTKGTKHRELIEALGPDGMGLPSDILLGSLETGYTMLGSNRILVPTEGFAVLDGHQRYVAAWHRLNKGWTTDPFGVKLILGSSQPEQARIFYQETRKHTPVAHLVHLRNAADSDITRALHKLEAENDDFPRVQWDQLKKAGEVITVHMLYEVTILLHGFNRKGTIEEILETLKVLNDNLDTDILVANVKTFFEMLNVCFVGTEAERYMYRADFLRGLAMLFAEYSNFWSSRNPYKLYLLKEDRRKLGKISWETIRSCLHSTTADTDLATQFGRQINKGREKKLQSRTWFEDED